MNTMNRTKVFKDWLDGLKDKKGKALILSRIDSAAAGNFGDHKLLEYGVYEMRIAYGPGYRMYCVRRAETVYLLLVGGNKSTQSRDIKLAYRMAKSLE